ncbi:MAG: M23 family metallopeptidase [Myxococcaceae bacterium]|nr:M23 family metallopeptidase [Myxococcaceae bacterium]
MSMLDPKGANGQASLDAFVFKQLLQSAGLDKGMSGMAGMVFTDVLSEAIARSSHLMPESSAAPPPQQTPGVTSGFGVRSDPFTRQPSRHDGVDVAGKLGDPIVAAYGGTVISAGERGGYGNAVEIDHGNGVHTLYAHASALDVKPGDVVQPGQKIGEVGSSGRSTGPHLHLELRINGRASDPSSALKAYRLRAEANE